MKALTRQEGGRCSACGYAKGKVRYSDGNGTLLCPWCAGEKGAITRERLQVDALEEMFFRAGIFNESPGERPFAHLSAMPGKENEKWPNGPS
jgi:hypothetical protein